MDEISSTTDSGSLGVGEASSRIESLLFPSEDKNKQEVERNETESQDDGSDVFEQDETTDGQEAPQEEVAEEAPQKYRLKDGSEVTLDEIEEWKRGTLRQSDYTRKTMEVAEQRKAIEARNAEIQQQSQYFAQNINFALQVAAANIPAEPPLSMIETDPIGFIQQKALFEEKMQELGKLQEAQAQHAQISQQQYSEQTAQRTRAEADMLMNAAPELRDPVKLQSFQKDLADVAAAYGISADEVNSVIDHRLILLARDAANYRKLMANRAKVADKTSSAVPVQKPGARPSPSQQAAQKSQDKIKTLAKSGSIRDAASIILDIL